MLPGKKNNRLKKKTVSKTVLSLINKDYSNDPFVIKKIESSKKIVEKYGFPKELINS